MLKSGWGLIVNVSINIMISQQYTHTHCKLHSTVHTTKQKLIKCCLPSTVFFSTLNSFNSVPVSEETPRSDLSMSISGTRLKALYGQAVGVQTYIEASLLDPDAVPKPPVAPLCVPKRVLPFIWLIWIPTWETSDELGELLHYTTRLLINHSNCTRCCDNTPRCWRREHINTDSFPPNQLDAPVWSQ